MRTARQLTTRRKTDRALLSRLVAEREGTRYKGSAYEQLQYWWTQVSAEQRLEFLRKVRIG